MEPRGGGIYSAVNAVQNYRQHAEKHVRMKRRRDRLRKHRTHVPRWRIAVGG
jgi:hypothetical protein